MTFQNVREVWECLEPGKSPSVRDLYDIWNQRLPVTAKTADRETSPGTVGGQVPWLQHDISLAVHFAEHAVQREEYLLARELYDEAMLCWQNGTTDIPSGRFSEIIRLKMQYAQAQTRLGFFGESRQVLESLLTNDQLAREQRGRLLLHLGHVRREEAHEQPTRSAQHQTAEEALKYYLAAEAEDAALVEASVLSAGILFVLSENEAARRKYAEQRARDLIPVFDAKDKTDGPSLQSMASRASLLCILGRRDEAAECYGRLKNVPGVTTRELAEIRYRSQFLAEGLGEARDFFKSAFPPLQLIVFAGHLPDLPIGTDRPGRFTIEAIPAIQEKLRRKLDEMQARVGLVGAAAGADLLFIEALLERPGADYHLVLPWSKDEFYETSVKPYEPKEETPLWKPLFDRALNRAATIRELGQVFKPTSDVGWEYMQEVTAGLALLTARTLRLDVQPLVVWDGLKGFGPGGTMSFVHFWSSQMQQPPLVINLQAPVKEQAVHEIESSPRVERDTAHQEVKTMLFADIVGYSKLAEKVMGDFVDRFLGRVSQLLAFSPNAPRSINTWGDAIYAVFDYTHQAGNFALELTRMLREGEAEWLKRGLYYEEFDEASGEKEKRPLSIRIGLHTGPVLAHYNPVVRQISYTGSHVSRAARIEPIAPPGEIYVSEEFAALSEQAFDLDRRKPASAGAGKRAFACEIVGTRPLAKNYSGRFRIYRLRPQSIAGMEDLARAVHESYCAEQFRKGKTPTDKPALRPWEELPESFREDNRALVADIPNKLHYLGYELAAGPGLDPKQIKISDEQREILAEREHERWMRQKLRKGFTLGPDDPDMRRRTNPCLIPYAELPESVKDDDRKPVMNMLDLIAKAGYRVRRLSLSGPR